MSLSPSAIEVLYHYRTARFLYTQRLENALTLKHLQHLTGIDPVVLNHYERGLTPMSVGRFLLLLDVLAVPFESIVEDLLRYRPLLGEMALPFPQGITSG